MFLKFREQVIRALGEYGDEKYIRESEHADLCSTIAFKLAKEQKRKPSEIADEIVENISIGEYIGSVQSVNGYINFFVSYEFLEDTIRVILDMDERYGFLNLKGEVLIEHRGGKERGFGKGSG